MKVNINHNLKEKNSQMQFEASIDYIQGTLPMCNVYEFFKDIEKIDSEFMLGNFQLWYGGLQNYGTRFCWFGEAFFNVCWNQDYFNENATKLNIPCLSLKTDLPIVFKAEEKNPYQGNNYGIFIKISGQGLMKIAEKPGRLETLFSYFLNQGFTPSRLDIALDCFNKDNPYVPMLEEAFRNAIDRLPGHYTIVSMMRLNHQNIQIRELSGKLLNSEDKVYNITFGNHGSSYGMFRLYDKFIELKERNDKIFEQILLEKCGSNKYWKRLEIELHGVRANDYFKAIMNGKKLSDCWANAVDKMFKVKITRNVRYSTTEKVRSDNCLPCELWNHFFEVLEKTIHLSNTFVNTPKVKKSKSDICNYTSRNANNIILGVGYAFSSDEKQNEFTVKIKDSIEKDARLRSRILDTFSDIYDYAKQLSGA